MLRCIPRRSRTVLIAATVAVLALALDYLAYPYGAAPAGPSMDTGRNGLWLRYTWYFGHRSDQDVEALARRLADHRIRYAYFHVRGIERSGALQFRYPVQARALTSAIHRNAPGVQAIAWVYAGNSRGEGAVDLASMPVRKRMVSEAMWLTTVCGFDGVQWDYEVCQDGEAGLPALLRETRTALQKGKLVSTAAPVWFPTPISRFGWSDQYIRLVCAETDQIAVMCYDTAFWMPRSYVWLVRQQAVHFTRAAHASPNGCRVVLGVPTHGRGLRSHNPGAENIGLALRGVRDGLAEAGPAATAFDGVAVFADYTTQPQEWATYRSLWTSGGSTAMPAR